MNDDKIEKIEEISEQLKTDKPDLGQDAARASPNKEHFDSLMSLDQQRLAPPIKTEASDKTTLLDQVSNINHKLDVVKHATPTQVADQARGVIAQIEEVKAKLATPDLELKSSVQTLIRNKLSHIDENLKVALNRAGLEYTPQAPTPATNLAGPIDRFLGLLTHGQYQLQRLANDVELMGKDSSRFTPASMLSIQLKVGYVQQELELFANLLNKSLESIKTIMNVQV